MQTATDPIITLAAEHAAWSQATFGSDAERGAEGPLRHLLLEADEVAANPGDISEHADVGLLWLDASRRAKHPLPDLLTAAYRRTPVQPVTTLKAQVGQCLARPRSSAAFASLGWLWLDGAFQAGHDLPALVAAMRAKLEVNKRRKWGVNLPGQPVEHVE
jgi:hypothetical protein